MNPADGPERCPDCSSERIAAISYGLPTFDEELRRDLEGGRVVLGGCTIMDRAPTWRCLGCGRQGGRLDLSAWPQPRPYLRVVPLLLLLGWLIVGSCLVLGLAYATLDHPRVGLAILLGLYTTLAAIPIAAVAAARWRMRRRNPAPNPDSSDRGP
jgi:hypothetical protein